MMGRARRWILVAAALTLLLLLASCGSGGGGGNETEALSKVDYLRRGNTICSKWQQERSDLITELNAQYVGKTPTNGDREKAILALAQPYGKAAKKLAALPAPQADAQKAKSVVTAMEKNLAAVEADPLDALNAMPEAEKANDLAQAYGLKECTF